jgi:dTDP-4-dehydrorhamnose reductase
VRTVVVGAAGMLGQDLTCDIGFSRSQLDVTDRRAVREAISKKDLVFNCAAWTDVDGAEEHEAEAMRVNRDGARNVAEAAGVVVYVSSDYVFDGAKGEPYVESDPVNPLSAYGRSKLEGEWATAEANPRHLIVRSSWLYGHGGRNFVETMLGLGPEVRVVDDQVGSPTYTPHLAAGLWPLAMGELYGIHHLAASGSCSWFEFAREIFERAGRDVRVEPCTTEELGRPAPRPAWSALRSERGHELPSWRDGLEAYLGVRV